MITILISGDEGKMKDILSRMLKEEGYSPASDSWGKNNIIKIVKKDSVEDLSSLKDTVIELEDSLYKEKRGVLYKSVLEMIEKPLIEHTLERTDGNQLRAAKILGINRNTIRSKIKRLGIDVDRWKV